MKRIQHVSDEHRYLAAVTKTNNFKLDDFFFYAVDTKFADSMSNPRAKAIGQYTLVEVDEPNDISEDTISTPLCSVSEKDSLLDKDCNTSEDSKQPQKNEYHLLKKKNEEDVNKNLRSLFSDINGVQDDADKTFLSHLEHMKTNGETSNIGKMVKCMLQSIKYV